MEKERVGISNEDFEKVINPFYDNVNDYISRYLVPEVVAFQLANFHYRGCLEIDKSSLLQQYNSMICVFSVAPSLEDTRDIIEDLLKVKYNLKIVSEKPLKLDKWY